MRPGPSRRQAARASPRSSRLCLPRSSSSPRADAAVPRAPRQSARPNAGRALPSCRPAMQAPIGALGNAHLFADEPVGAGAQHRRCTGRQCLLRRQLHEMQHLAVVSVVDQRTRRQRVRRRPFDRPRADSGGEFPLECGGQPGIARVLPIRVPPFLHREAQRNRERFARDERRLRGDELGLDALGFHRRGKRSRCKRDRCRSNERDAEADRQGKGAAEHQWVIGEGARLGATRGEKVPGPVSFYPGVCAGTAPGKLGAPRRRRGNACRPPSHRPFPP